MVPCLDFFQPKVEGFCNLFFLLFFIIFSDKKHCTMSTNRACKENSFSKTTTKRCVSSDGGSTGSSLILNTLSSTLNMSVFLCSLAAIQKEVEGKAWDYLIRIMMSLRCFSWPYIRKRLLSQHQCVTVCSPIIRLLLSVWTAVLTSNKLG